MSKTAIKNFFDHQREVTARREAYYKRLEEEMNNPKEEEVVIDTTVFDKEVEYFDFLLKRNWFLDVESIVDLLMDADEDVFQEIIKRASSYDEVIREVIYSFLPLPIGNLKLKLVRLTDEEVELQEIEREEKRQKEMLDAWEAYKTEQKLEPPVGYLDADLDEMYSELQELKKNLEDAKKKSLTGRYVLPAMRDKVVAEDPKVLEVTKRIEKTENEIVRQNQRIEQEHDEWFMRKRNEFEQKMLSV